MINNGIISAKLNKGDPLPDGWQYGFANGGQKKGCRFVNDGVRTICIEPGDPIPDGFHSGYANKPEKRQCITDGNVFKAIPAN